MLNRHSFTWMGAKSMEISLKSLLFILDDEVLHLEDSADGLLLDEEVDIVVEEADMVEEDLLPEDPEEADRIVEDLLPEVVEDGPDLREENTPEADQEADLCLVLHQEEEEREATHDLFHDREAL